MGSAGNHREPLRIEYYRPEIKERIDRATTPKRDGSSRPVIRAGNPTPGSLRFRRPKRSRPTAVFSSPELFVVINKSPSAEKPSKKIVSSSYTCNLRQRTPEIISNRTAPSRPLRRHIPWEQRVFQASQKSKPINRPENASAVASNP